MSRINVPYGVDRRSNDVASQVRQEVQRVAPHERHLGRWMFLTVCLLVVAGVLWLGAKSGTWQVPILSGLVYHPEMAAPTRLVRPVAGSSSVEVAKAVSAAATFAPNAGTALISLSEEQLTTLVAEAVAAQGTTSIVGAQVVVTPLYVELVASRVATNGQLVPFRLRAVPGVKDGKLDLVVSEVLIGSLSVPSWLRGAIGVGAVTAFEKSVGGLGTGSEVLEVNLADKLLRVTLRPVANK